MNKYIKVENIDYWFDWESGVSISKIKDDINEMEKLGATHINIEYSEYFSSCGISMKAEKHRLETDEEYDERINHEKNKLKVIEAKELAELDRLKKKYGI